MKAERTAVRGINRLASMTGIVCYAGCVGMLWCGVGGARDNKASRADRRTAGLDRTVTSLSVVCQEAKRAGRGGKALEVESGDAGEELIVLQLQQSGLGD